MCRDTLDFQVELMEADGKQIDVLNFWRVPPAAYLFILDDLSGLPDGMITLRFVYGEAEIWDAKVKHASQK